MPTRHSREGENPEGTGWENHGNHYPIMAIMVQKLPPFAFTPCHSERSEEPPPFAPRKGARGMHTSNPRPLPRRRESRAEGTGKITAIISKSRQSFPHHGNHGSNNPNHNCRNVGSTRSRNQSPRKLPDITTIAITKPGNNDVHQAASMY